jgi:predicted RNA binding protein with dsRBD fold (UPF0201 family)
MITIYKTNITHQESKNKVLNAIREHLPGIVATLELEDNDRVLRVVGVWAPVTSQQIIDLVRNQGFTCEEL